jgi:hypothetical protein
VCSVKVTLITGSPTVGASEVTKEGLVTAVELSEDAITEELVVPVDEDDVEVEVPSDVVVVPSAFTVVVTGVDVVVVVVTGVVSRIVSV